MNLELLREAAANPGAEKRSGHLHFIQKYWSLEGVYHFTMICNHCQKRNTPTFDNSFYWCNECMETSPKNNKVLEEINTTLKNFNHVSTKNANLNIDTELDKIEFSIADMIFYGVMKSRIEFEPNEWSSTPHDNYVIKWDLFIKKEQRDAFWAL